MMRARPIRVALAVLLLCGGSCRVRAPTDTPAARCEQDDRGVTRGAADVAARTRVAGVAHTNTIDRVALGADGRTALSRDASGGLRVWTALDGTVEPIVIPERGAQAFSVQRSGVGVTVAVVDAAGGGKIFTVGADAAVALVGELPPFDALFELHVLPAGRGVVGLFRDHSVRLMDRSGAVLAAFSERRFRPTSLVVGVQGDVLAAIVLESDKRGAEIQRLRLDRSGPSPKIVREGPPTVVRSKEELSRTTLAISADVARVGWLQGAKDNAWEVAVAALGEESPPRAFTVEIPTHRKPILGFGSATQLLVSTDDGTLSWLRDLTSNTTHARSAAPPDFAGEGRAQAVGGGTHLAASGTWLFVHDLNARSHYFLGYGSVQTQSVALSPDGAHVAWSYATGHVFVESLREQGEPAVKVARERWPSLFKIRFVGGDQLLLVGASGRMQLLRWRTGETIDEAGIIGSVRAVHTRPAGDIVLVERHNGDAWVFTLSPKGFGAPSIVADKGYRTGLFARGSKAHGGAVMWSMDSTSQLRYYPMKALRSDLAREAIAARGVPLAPQQVAPLALDARGRHYGVRWNGAQMELFVRTGETTKVVPAPGGDVNQIIPSPDGARFVALHQRGNTMTVSVHDRETLELLWTYASGVLGNEIAWSADGRFVGIAATTGAVVLRAADGEVVRRRCGSEFTKTAAQPQPTAVSQLPSLCEG